MKSLLRALTLSGLLLTSAAIAETSTDEFMRAYEAKQQFDREASIFSETIGTINNFLNTSDHFSAYFYEGVNSQTGDTCMANLNTHIDNESNRSESLVASIGYDSERGKMAFLHSSPAEKSEEFKGPIYKYTTKVEGDKIIIEHMSDLNEERNFKLIIERVIKSVIDEEGSAQEKTFLKGIEIQQEGVSNVCRFVGESLRETINFK